MVKLTIAGSAADGAPSNWRVDLLDGDTIFKASARRSSAAERLRPEWPAQQPAAAVSVGNQLSATVTGIRTLRRIEILAEPTVTAVSGEKVHRRRRICRCRRIPPVHHQPRHHDLPEHGDLQTLRHHAQHDAGRRRRRSHPLRLAEEVYRSRHDADVTINSISVPGCVRANTRLRSNCRPADRQRRPHHQQFAPLDHRPAGPAQPADSRRVVSIARLPAPETGADDHRYAFYRAVGRAGRRAASDDGFADASDPQAWLLGRQPRLYSSKSNPPGAAQDWKGRFGFIQD